MAKRFTDTHKWRNEWFRTLPVEARLAWIYLCDECESHGVIKLDYGLAAFQLGFSIEREKLIYWFGNKIYFIDEEKLLILGFFEFQYGESKDSWTAKIRAQEKIENLGFVIENNKILIPDELIDTTLNPQWGDSTPTRLIRVIGKGIGNNNKIKEENFFKKSDAEELYQAYPKKVGKESGCKKLIKMIKNEKDLADFKKAMANYLELIQKEETDPKFIKQWSTFVNNYRDYLEVSVPSKQGLLSKDNPRQKAEEFIDHAIHQFTHNSKNAFNELGRDSYNLAKEIGIDPYSLQNGTQNVKYERPKWIRNLKDKLDKNPNLLAVNNGN